LPSKKLIKFLSLFLTGVPEILDPNDDASSFTTKLMLPSPIVSYLTSIISTGLIDNAKVDGRITTAHSDHDKSLWIAYPLASGAFRDTYSLGLVAPLEPVFGGPTDRYGAIGANGPQNLTIGVHLLNLNGTSLPELKPGVNVPDCTSFVASHSDVWKQGSAYIVAAGLLSE